ncbi:AbrB/MazE/SpoVT family DNA-binding domain-containing protein [Candidatus Bathyarchaeota archaeon]|nr:AbrB/MazE/SpoVT family DNA-binding domain-containing protein [Candidatus Bathyarchaeota archaeon]
MSEKGQVVIPKVMREKLKLGPKTKLLIYGHGDTLILKKLVVPDVESELKALWKDIDQKIGKKRRLTQKEIDEEIHTYREES